jgi:hypothetical protein
MLGDFFIWCAGSDKHVLSKCEDSVRIKHIGLGTLVLIPAILGFISMTYALSTIDLINNKPEFYFLGGVIWGLIIFAFDRFIVSTHRKQQRNIEEFFTITFYLRLIFAFILGIIVSHPFVLLYFDGSIKEQIIKDRDKSLLVEESNYQTSVNTISINLNNLKVKKSCLESLLTYEQSGVRKELPCGSSSGIPNINGSFPRTSEIKKQIEDIKIEIEHEEKRISAQVDDFSSLKNNSQGNINMHTSFDYLKREITLEKLKEENVIISLTQILLIIAFILVDILPLVFKTFSPFSMYDKILVDDTQILRGISTESRKITLQKAYDKISKVYVVSRELDSSQEYKEYLQNLSQEYGIFKNAITGVMFGLLLSIVLYVFGILGEKSVAQLPYFMAALSIIFSIIANFITRVIEKLIVKQEVK